MSLPARNAKTSSRMTMTMARIMVVVFMSRVPGGLVLTLRTMSNCTGHYAKFTTLGKFRLYDALSATLSEAIARFDVPRSENVP